MATSEITGLLQTKDSSGNKSIVYPVTKIEAVDGLSDALNAKLSTAGGTITGNLKLKGSGNYGNKLNFGDGDFVHIYEPTDDHLEIKASYLNFIIPGIERVTINGEKLSEKIGGTSFSLKTESGTVALTEMTFDTTI